MISSPGVDSMVNNKQETHAAWYGGNIWMLSL